MQQIHLRAAVAALLASPLLLTSCSTPMAAATPTRLSFVGLGQDEEVDGEYEDEEERLPILVEASMTPRSGGSDGDNVYGVGVYGYRDSAWGVGIQFQSTLRRTDPELEILLNPPSRELSPRTTELVVDVVATRRLSPNFGVFAGGGIAVIEDYRRFVDLIGNDFFVRSDRDIRANVTAGVHVWLSEALTLSAQWDSIFEAATFGVGWEF